MISIELNDQQAQLITDWAEQAIEEGDNTTASISVQIVDKIKEQQ